MDRKYTKNNKAVAFLKRNIYYIIMFLCLAAIATMVTVTLIKKSKAPNVNVIAPPNPIEDSDKDKDVDRDNKDGDEDKDKDKEQDPPVYEPEPIVFACPVKDVNIGRDYAMDSIVWHTTLGHYAVSRAIVFLGDEGDDVFAAYGGTVEEVTNDVFYGNRIVINHDDGLRTIYYSLKDVAVSKNQKVTKGQLIGTMGTTASQEISDGPHVHFEVSKDNTTVSPYDYLDIGDK